MYECPSQAAPPAHCSNESARPRIAAATRAFSRFGFLPILLQGSKAILQGG